jgi:dipeptidyl aminopeptidase/acylaminoacyl peptidase
MDKLKAQKLPGDSTLPSTPEELQQIIDANQGEYKYSVEDFFRTPEKSNYQLSPDGTHFAFMSPYKRRKNIFVQKIGETEATRITSETTRDIGGFGWVNSNRIIFIKDNGGDENFTLLAVDKNGENLKDLTPFENIRISVIDDLKEDDDHIIIGLNNRNPQLFEPYRLNVDTGVLNRLADNIDPTNPLDGWMTDHEGKLRIATKIIGTNTTILYRENEEEDFNNQNQVYVASNLNRDKSVVIKFDMTTSQEVGEPIFSHEFVDVTNLGYSRKRKVLTAVSYTTAKTQYHFLDNKTKSAREYLESKLGDYEISVASKNRAEDKMIVRTYSDRSLGAYYFYDSEINYLEKITDVSPWIDEDDMAEMLPVIYPTRDKLTINGYLTLPKNVEPKNLPVIINPHGGPWVRDSWGYNPEVQLLVSRGYAVLQMNYRGSTGYGRNFWEMSFKQWGKTMQNDISDGVAWLVQEGIANPKKVAIYGGSYGGYATLAGVTFTPNLYTCAIDYVGVSNLFTFLHTIPPYWKPYLNMMHEMVGHPEKDKEHMAAASPALHVDKITTPLFVIQGANDPRVNIDESDQIVRSLRSRNIDVPYMVKYDEGHGFHNEENRFEVYNAMLGFLGKYL